MQAQNFATKERNRRWREANREKLRAGNRAYRMAHPDTCKAATAKWKADHPEAYRRTRKRAHLKATFGLTLEQYEAMCKAQHNKCAICDKEPNILVVDHDHNTGRIRGLLCHACNKALGVFEDSPSLLRKAAVYAEK